MPGHQLGRGHIDVIDIGTFLTIYLDIHEVLVHLLGDGRALKDLAFHHVAPVTGGVADTQKDRFVFQTGFGEGLATPRMPVDRIVCMLQQIGTGLSHQGVGVFPRPVGVYQSRVMRMGLSCLNHNGAFHPDHGHPRDADEQ